MRYLHCTGHSLGGFAAATCLILCDHILTCTAFESPGLTTFYHRLAAQKGDEEFWCARITNYLAIPNPINMCQRHLGRIVRCAHMPPHPFKSLRCASFLTQGACGVVVDMQCVQHGCYLYVGCLTLHVTHSDLDRKCLS